MNALLSFVEMRLLKGQRTRIFTYAGLGITVLGFLSGEFSFLLSALAATYFISNATAAEHKPE